MEFGEVPVAGAAGAVLAHSLKLGDLRLQKGHVLTEDDVAALISAGEDHVTVARLAPDDVAEDAAATRLAAPLGGPHLRITQPVSGRVNLIATAPGVLRVDAAAIAAFNAVDEAITIATLPDYARVHDGTLVATIKIIPYAAGAAHVETARAALSADAITLHPFADRDAALILTRTPGLKESLLTKGEEVVRNRLNALGVTLSDVVVTDHDTAAVTDAVQARRGRMLLILGGSATSDRRDVAPAAVVAAGGRIARFGMPVDPGNLLFLGDLDGHAVVGLPGCARAPALNGADWVLERLAAGLEVSTGDIAAMGVGGLLKEVPARGQPRRARKGQGGRPHVLLLAAGSSSRMRGEHKLLRRVDGQPLVLRTAARLAAAGFPLHIVADPANAALMDLLHGAGHSVVPSPDAPAGLSASLRAGIAALPAGASAVIVALADMPDITAAHLHALADAHNPVEGALIVAPVAPNGKRGNPVLFDRRYFEPLASLSGDAGAKSLIEAEAEAVITVPADAAVLTDLDTPEAWSSWESSRPR